MIPWLHQRKHPSVAPVGAILRIKIVSSLSRLTYPIIFISASNLTATGSVYSLLEGSASLVRPLDRTKYIISQSKPKFTTKRDTQPHIIFYQSLLPLSDFECRKTKTKVIYSSQSQTTHIIQWTNHKPKSLRVTDAKGGKNVQTRHHQLWFYFWLDEKVARDFSANHTNFSSYCSF